jgi:hypothetical protein
MLGIKILTHVFHTDTTGTAPCTFSQELLSTIHTCCVAAQTTTSSPHTVPVLPRALSIQVWVPAPAGDPCAPPAGPLTTGSATALLGWLQPLLAYTYQSYTVSFNPHLPALVNALAVSAYCTPVTSLTAVLHILLSLTIRPDTRLLVAASDTGPRVLMAACALVATGANSGTELYGVASDLLFAVTAALVHTGLYALPDLRAAVLPIAEAALSVAQVAPQSLVAVARMLVTAMDSSVSVLRSLWSVPEATLRKLALSVGERKAFAPHHAPCLAEMSVPVATKRQRMCTSWCTNMDGGNTLRDPEMAAGEAGAAVAVRGVGGDGGRLWEQVSVGQHLEELAKGSLVLECLLTLVCHRLLAIIQFALFTTVLQGEGCQRCSNCLLLCRFETRNR